MSVTIKVEFNHLPEIAAKAENLIAKVVEKTALELEGNIKERMAEAKSGRIYRSHQASAPGEAPAIDTAELLRSIKTDVQGASASVGTNSKYAEYLENGTTKMAARPVWVPETEKMQDDFVEGVISVLKDLD